MTIIELTQFSHKKPTSVYVVCEHITGFFQTTGRVTRIYTNGVSFVDVTETPEQIIALIANVMPIDLTS